MKQIIIFCTLLLTFSCATLFSQIDLTAGKKLLHGKWKGKEIDYYDQIISFIMKPVLPYDSATIQALEKRFGAKILEYDDYDGYVTIEKPKGTNMFKAMAELEKDTTLRYISPIIKRGTYVLSEREKAILRKRVDDSLEALSKKKAIKKAEHQKNSPLK
jgi:hypothetical protein